MKKILLDTNAYTALLSNDKKVFDVISSAEIVYMSVFVLGELFYGFKYGSNEKKNNEILKNFLSKPTVELIQTTTNTAENFGIIKSNLRKSGTPIPINDVWIAAHCLENGAMLISYDKHFINIQNLRVFDLL